MKRPFINELPGLVKMFGLQVKRGVLIKYCRDNNIVVPALLREHKGTQKGTFNLEPLMRAGDSIYDLPPRPERESGVYVSPTYTAPDPEPERTDAEILDNIDQRFASLDLMTYGVVNGDFRSMIVSGNPGIGKTYTLEYILESARDASKIKFESVRGFVRATGLFRALYEHREKGSVIMFDDSDSVFGDETGLNLLKGALDTTKKRSISWLSERTFVDEVGIDIPRTFDFNGSVVFVTNIDFQREVRRQSRLSPHLDALMSRSYYLDLNLTGIRELVLRIKSVVEKTEILTSMTISKRDQRTIVKYIEDHADQFRECSLRAVIKLGQIWRAAADPEEFTRMANATMLVRTS